MPSCRLDNVNSIELPPDSHTFFINKKEHTKQMYMPTLSTTVGVIIIVIMRINDVLFMSRILGPKANHVQL